MKSAPLGSGAVVLVQRARNRNAVDLGEVGMKNWVSCNGCARGINKTPAESVHYINLWQSGWNNQTFFKKKRASVLPERFHFSLWSCALAILQAWFQMRGFDSSNLSIVLQHVFCVLLLFFFPLLLFTPLRTVPTDPSAGSLVIHGAAEVIRSAAENADYELVTHILIACTLVAQHSLANSNI